MTEQHSENAQLVIAITDVYLPEPATYVASLVAPLKDVILRQLHLFAMLIQQPRVFRILLLEKLPNV